jgi:hypothetical protein
MWPGIMNVTLVPVTQDPNTGVKTHDTRCSRLGDTSYRCGGQEPPFSPGRAASVTMAFGGVAVDKSHNRRWKQSTDEVSVAAAIPTASTQRRARAIVRRFLLMQGRESATDSHSEGVKGNVLIAVSRYGFDHITACCRPDTQSQQFASVSRRPRANPKA